MENKFLVQIKGKCHLLERLIFPRFRAVLDCDKPLPEIIKIRFIDDCDPRAMAEAIREIEPFLRNYGRQ